MTTDRPPLPPFTRETAARKVRAAGGRVEHPRPAQGRARLLRGLGLAQPRHLLTGRAAIVEFLTAEWARELEYARCARTSGPSTATASPSAFAVRVPRRRRPQWWRSYGNELWEFDEHGLMTRREASINDVAITESDRRIHGPRRPFSRVPG